MRPLFGEKLLVLVEAGKERRLIEQKPIDEPAESRELGLDHTLTLTETQKRQGATYSLPC